MSDWHFKKLNNMIWKGRICLLLSCLLVMCIMAKQFVPAQSQPGSSRYICQTFNGRLGNHIYQYASVYGIARLHDMTVVLGEQDDIARYFKVPSAKILSNRNGCRSFVRRTAKRCCTFDQSLMHLDNNTSYLVGEYLQSWKYFSHVMDEVRRELTLKDEIQQSAVYKVEQYRTAYSVKSASEVVMVGVHIRRGDLVSNPVVGNDGSVPAPKHYIYRAVAVILRRFSNVVFIVCSDDSDYAENLFQRSVKTLRVIHIHDSPIHDFAVLASCDHVIMTHGTFGWWAGFLSNGTVIYYKYPTREESFARTEYNYADYFPPDWIGLE